MVSMSQPVLLDVGYFLIHLSVGVTQIVSGFFFVGNCSMRICRLVCLWEEVRSGASDITILDWNPLNRMPVS